MRAVGQFQLGRLVFKGHFLSSPLHYIERMAFRDGENVVLKQIQHEITQPYYQQNFSNDGTRFVAWYLRRVLRRDSPMHDITDGANDKQIDAVVVDDDERRVIIVQGKFLDGTKVDGEPLREVLSAWARLNDLGSLQNDCNEKLRQKLEAVRQAIDDDYDIQFELLTTGEVTDAARDDLKAFSTRLEETTDLPATLQLIDTEVIRRDWPKRMRWSFLRLIIPLWWTKRIRL